jgi:amino acid transporter
VLFGVAATFASFFPLDFVISALMAARILIQFMAQVVAVILIRRNRPDIHRPFKMWLFPLPAIISFVGYAYIFGSLGVEFMLFGVLTLVVGAGVYMIAAKNQKAWPFDARRVA